MLGRDWLHHFALMGWLIAGLILVVPLHAQDNSNHQPEVVAPSQPEKVLAPPLAVTVVGQVSLEKGKTAEPNWATPECTNPQNHDEADLCEQKRMAKASEEAVWWARLQTWLGGVGFFVIIATLIFTGISTKAAVDQSKVAREAFIKLERPYIFIFGADRLESDINILMLNAPFVEYSVANYGKTPAIIKHASAVINTGTEPDLPLRLDSDHPLFVSRIIAPDERRDDLHEGAPEGVDFTHIGSITVGQPTEVVPQLSGQDDLFFRVIITYRGPFTDHHETSACWRYDGLTNRLIQHGGSDYNYER